MNSIIATEIVLPGLVEPSGLEVHTRDLPSPSSGQVVLRMEATGVSFAEQQMRRGLYWDQPPFPFVPGYDVVGTVVATGSDVEASMVGRRFAAVTKIGAWASHLLIDATELLPVPDGADAASVATLVVNGITAWQMLHRIARVPSGGTILVLGANGGVGSTLVQLARHAGISVIGTASSKHQETVRALGAIPIDYNDPTMYDRIRELAPHGVNAVFDHVGGAGLKQSWRALRRGGTLVSYGSAATKNSANSSRTPMIKLYLRVAAWKLLPNGKHAHFYNFWDGQRNHSAWHGKLSEDVTQVLQLLTDGQLVPQIAAEMPLTAAAAALELAESRTVVGKVILVP